MICPTALYRSLLFFHFTGQHVGVDRKTDRRGRLGDGAPDNNATQNLVICFILDRTYVTNKCLGRYELLNYIFILIIIIYWCAQRSYLLYIILLYDAGAQWHYIYAQSNHYCCCPTGIRYCDIYIFIIYYYWYTCR